MSEPNAITLGIAIVGATLGIINTWRSFDRDRIRLKIIPKWAMFRGGTQTLCIDIINLGYIPVTINQVGFRLRERNKVFIFMPMPMPGSELPKRLEPRTSFTVLAPLGTEQHESMRNVTVAFVKTACLRTFTGNSAALRGEIRQRRLAWKKDRKKSA